MCGDLFRISLHRRTNACLDLAVATTEYDQLCLLLYQCGYDIQDQVDAFLLHQPADDGEQGNVFIDRKSKMFLQSPLVFDLVGK